MENGATQRLPITDSPWFWVLASSLVGLVGLAAIHDKYGKRQAGIERQYQARERTAEQVAAIENGQATIENAGKDVPLPDYATPGHNLISIWPLFVLLIVVGVVAAMMLARERRQIAAKDGSKIAGRPSLRDGARDPARSEAGNLP